MDIDPPLFKRKKSRPSRTREVEIADGGDTGDEPGESPMALASKLLNKQKARAKPQAKLSFGMDDEGGGGDTFKMRKSELSKKAKLGKASPLIASMATSTDGTTASNSPSYTSEYLSQLKAANAAPPLRPLQSLPIPTDDIEAYNADELEAMGMEDIIDASSAAGGVIPGGATVVDAKKKRERLRAIGASNASASGGVPEEEFISLSLTKREEKPYEGPHPESRLMREEDDMGDGEDELAEFTGAKERVALGKKAKKAESKRRRAGMAEMIEDVEQDEDEEAREWEETQIRRNEGPDRKTAEASQKQTYKPAPIPASVPLPTLAPSVARLTASLSALTTSHNNNATALNNIGDERNALERKEAELRRMVDEAETKRAWFKEFRDWIESVADFLDAKFPLLEKFEQEHVSLLTERYGMISKRREEDDEDDACLFLRLPEKPSTSDQVDDLGRTQPSFQQGPHGPIRKARRADRERRQAAASDAMDQGFATDSTLPPSDAADFEEAVASLRRRIDDLLSDVQLRDFKDARLAVAKRFADWRQRFGESYSGAWGGLGAVGAWEFWARLEMVGWDPVRETRSLDSFEWYTGLYEYSRPRISREDAMEEDDDEDEDEPPLGPDGDLVTSMVSTAVIPRLCTLISGGAFDPYSMKDVRKVVDLAEQVEMCISRDDMKFLTLVQAVTRVFGSAVTSICDIVRTSVPHPSFDPSALHARLRFLSRRLKLLTVLLRWRKYVGERFGMMEMVHRLVREAMMPVAMGGWEVGGKDIMKKVVQALPVDLSLPELSNQIATA